MADETRHVIVNNLPYSSPEDDPLEALRTVLAFSVDDWSETRAMAWVWGIVNGWDDEAMTELADRFVWHGPQVARLRQLHAAFNTLSPRPART